MTAPPEVKERKDELKKIYGTIYKLRIRINKLRKQIDNTPIDPRSSEINEKIRSTDAEIEQYKDELRILKKQNKVQGGTLTKLNYNPRMENRVDEVRDEIIQTKDAAKILDKQFREMKIDSLLQVIGG